MIAILRFIRIICGIFAVFVLFPTLGNLSQLLAVSSGKGYFSDPDGAFAIITVQIVFLSASIFLFFFLRKLINKMHKDQYGEEHPKLGKSRWAL